MILACIDDNKNAVHFLVKRGADVKTKSSMEQTALHFAASHGSAIAVKELLKHNRNPNIRTENGCSALHLAVLNGHLDTIETLVECGRDLQAKDQYGYSCTIMQCFLKRVKS